MKQDAWKKRRSAAYARTHPDAAAVGSARRAARRKPGEATGAPATTAPAAGGATGAPQYSKRNPPPQRLPAGDDLMLEREDATAAEETGAGAATYTEILQEAGRGKHGGTGFEFSLEAQLDALFDDLLLSPAARMQWPLDTAALGQALRRIPLAQRLDLPAEWLGEKLAATCDADPATAAAADPQRLLGMPVAAAAAEAAIDDDGLDLLLDSDLPPPVVDSAAQPAPATSTGRALGPRTPEEADIDALLTMGLSSLSAADMEASSSTLMAPDLLSESSSERERSNETTAPRVPDTTATDAQSAASPAARDGGAPAGAAQTRPAVSSNTKVATHGDEDDLESWLDSVL